MTARPQVEASYPPEGLSRTDAARYVGVSGTTFDELVAKGEMPLPRRYRNCRRLVWLRRELDVALEELPVDGSGSPKQGADYQL